MLNLSVLGVQNSMTDVEALLYNNKLNKKKKKGNKKTKKYGTF